MNLAVRGIDADIRWNNEGSFHKDELKDLRFDYVLANPPFNISDWGGERLREDARWNYGAPPVGNANYAWLEHILWHLAPNGTAGFAVPRSLHLDIGCPDHLAPLLGIVGDELAEVGR
jgi:type I restriction enzyme M protein